MTSTWVDEFGITLSVDAQGRVHRGKGAGGGQFTKEYSGGGADDERWKDTAPEDSESGRGGGKGRRGGKRGAVAGGKESKDKAKPGGAGGEGAVAPEQALEKLATAGLAPLERSARSKPFDQDEINDYSADVLHAASKAGLLIAELDVPYVGGITEGLGEYDDDDEDIGGAEHRVYIDEENDHVYKITRGPYHTGMFGLSNDAHEYLRRLEAMNRLWPSLGIKFLGVINRRGKAVIATSMNRIDGTVPEQEEIHEWFRGNGWEPASGAVEYKGKSYLLHWKDPVSGTYIGDTHSGNFLKTSAGLVPIDVTVDTPQTTVKGEGAAMLSIEAKREIVHRCLDNCDGDVEAGLAAAQYLIERYPALTDVLLSDTNTQGERGHWVTTEDGNHLFISEEGHVKTKPGGKVIAERRGRFEDKKAEVKAKKVSAAFAHDIHNRRAQGVLNATLKAASALSRDARAALRRILRKPPAERTTLIAGFVDEYRLQLARLLTSTQLATLLEGMREVASMVPPLALFPGAVPPPPSLDPREATRLVERLAAMTAEERAEEIYALPSEQQEYVRQALAAHDAGPMDPPQLGVADLDEDDVHLATIDEAVRELSGKNVLTRPMYDALGAAVRAKAFTIAGVTSEETLTRVRDALARNAARGADLREFRRAVLKEVGAGTFLSDAHMETVFRTNIQSAFSDGQMAVLQQPAVRAGFPYAAYDAIHDDRVREEHLALEEHGIGGSNVYRADDPVFKLFRPPWDYNDRCSWTPMTVRQAAEMGVEEARKWLESGSEPQPPAFVSMPPFQPPAGFQRSLAAEPMALRLSLQPMSFAHEGPRDSLERNVRADLIAGILVLLYGDEAEEEARKLVEGGDIALSSAPPQVRRRYGAQPGPGWVPGGLSRNGVQIWLWRPHHAPAAAPSAPAAPAAPPPPAAPAAPAAPPVNPNTAVQQSRLANARAALAAIQSKVAAGTPLTAADKTGMVRHLGIMQIGMLRQLYSALGGTAALNAAGGNASAARATVRAMLTGTAPAAPAPAAPSAPAPAAPAPAPSVPSTSAQTFNTGFGGFDNTVNDMLAGKPVPADWLGAAVNDASMSVDTKDVAKATIDLGGSLTNPGGSLADFRRALMGAFAKNASAAMSKLPTHVQAVGANIRALVLAVKDKHITQSQAIADIDAQLGLIATKHEKELAEAMGADAGSATDFMWAVNEADPGHVGPSPPGPPPRPGLVWDATTHRWTRPAAAPSVLHRGSNVITGKPAAAAAVVPPAPTSHLGPNDYVPPPPRLVKVSKYGGNASAGGLPSSIDHNTISGYSNNPLQLSKDFTKGTGGPSVAAQYSHSPSGYKVVASWSYGAPPNATAKAPYEIFVFDDKGTIVSTYKTYASRDPAYVEARTVQVAAWLEKQLPKLTAKPATTSNQLAQFAWDYANQGGTSAKGAPFGISGAPADRPKMEGYLRAEYPKLVGAQQHGPHGGMDTVEHTMNIVHPDNLRTAGLPQRDAELLRLGMLYHDVGKQHDPRDPEHPRKSAEDVKDLLWQFGLTEREYADTMVVIKHHDAYGFAMQGKKGMSGPADVAKLAYEYTDDKLPPAQRATEAKRISDLLMRAWQSDVSTIPGLTSKPIPGRPDLTPSGFLDVDKLGPDFAKRVAAEIDKMQGGALPKGFKPPDKPTSALTGTPRPNLVPKGLKWGEIVQRADHTHGGELPVGPQVPYDSTKVPPKEVYDEAKQHPELNYARAFDMGYDGPTGLIIKAYHGQDPNNGKAQNKITAGLIVDTGMRPGSNGDNVFGHGIYTFVNGADRMTANYASDSIIQMEVHTGRMVDHDHLVNHIIPQWRRANPNGAANLPRGVNAEKTAAALWAGYSTISLGYYGGEPAVVVLDPSRVRINKIVGDRSGGYKGMDVKATRGNVNTGGLTSEEKKTKKGNEGYLDTKSNGAPIGWDGKARIN